MTRAAAVIGRYARGAARVRKALARMRTGAPAPPSYGDGGEHGGTGGGLSGVRGVRGVRGEGGVSDVSGSAARAARVPPRLSRWAWTADVALALVLAVGTVVADLDRSFYESGQDAPQVVAPAPGGALPEVPPPPPGEAPPPPPEPGSRPLPEPGSPGAGERDEEPSDGSRGRVTYPRPPVVEHVLPPAQGWELALGVLASVPLVVRRRYPLAAFWAVLCAAVLFHRGEVAQGATAFAFAAGVVAAYSAAMYSPYRKGALLSLLAGVPLFAFSGLVPDVGRGFVPLLVLLPIGLAANAIHTWQQRVRTLQEQQEAATRLAVDQERSRIARELHDVVTHNVSMMTIQAGAARKVLDTSPEQAREAMRAVEAGGRAAMAELRHVMGLLTMAAARPAGEGADADPAGDPTTGAMGATGAAVAAGAAGPAASTGPMGPMGSTGPAGTGPAAGAGAADPAVAVDLAPQPGLGQLTALVGRVRDTGVAVELTVTGAPEAPLPAGVDLAAYRVVQEALTNAVKHAAGAAVSVTVAHAPGELRVEVTDTGGPPTARAAAGSGRGLIGLRERLAVYGGTLHAARRPRGGYRVRAVIPVPRQPPEPPAAG